MTSPMTPRWHRIRRTIRETRDTFTLDLEPVAPAPVPGFVPGQFNMITMHGVGEVPISISGDPGDPSRLLHTIRAYGAVTSRMQTLKKGQAVGLRGPYGVGWPMDRLAGKDLFLCAGGIGLAPLRPVLYAVLARRDVYGRVTVVYGERTPDDLLYRHQLERWRGRFDMDIRVTVDSARRGWCGDVGVVTALMAALHIDPARTVALLCGPEIMMRCAIEVLAAKGLADERILISMERNMQCGIGMCGHCQAGPLFVCRDGPVFRYDRVKALFNRREC